MEVHPLIALVRYDNTNGVLFSFFLNLNSKPQTQNLHSTPIIGFEIFDIPREFILVNDKFWTISRELIFSDDSRFAKINSRENLW